MKFIVEILTTDDRECSQHMLRNLSVARARKLVERHARRGVKIFGGSVSRMNWGSRGGAFPNSYRIAVIKPERRS